MRDSYDFSKGISNPYIEKMGKQQVTIRLDEGVVQYFKDMSEEVGIPYQTIINLYLRECAGTGKRLNLEWLQPK